MGEHGEVDLAPLQSWFDLFQPCIRMFKNPNMTS